MSVAREQHRDTELPTDVRGRRARPPSTIPMPALAGAVHDVPLTMVLFGLEIGSRTGVVRVRWLDRSADVFVERGRLITQDDADAAARELAEVLAWQGGRYEVELGVRVVGPASALPLGVVMPRATRILERATLLLSGLPHPSARLELDPSFDTAEIEDAWSKQVLALFDGERSLLRVLHHHPGREQHTADAIRGLWLHGALRVRPLDGQVRAVAPEPPLDAPPRVERPTLSGWRRLWDWMRGRPTESTPRPGELERPPLRASMSESRATLRSRLPDDEASWERYRAAAGDTPEQIRTHLSRALLAELETCQEACDRGFVERLLASLDDRVEAPPPFPLAARILAAALRSGNLSLSQAAEIVRTDSRLVRRVTIRASSIESGRPTEDLEIALQRIGLHCVFRFAASEVLAVAEAASIAYRPETSAVRRGAMVVAEVAAGLEGGASREDLFLAGLLHEIGVLEIHRIAALGEPPAASRLRALALAYQTSFGALLVRRWHLGREVEHAVARFAEAESGDVELPWLARALRVAQIASHVVLCGADPSRARAAIERVPDGPWDVDEILDLARSAAASAPGRAGGGTRGWP